MSKGKPLPIWFRHLDLTECLVVLLASHQSRLLRVLISKLRDRWSAKEIEAAVEALGARGAVERDARKDAFRVTARGRLEALKAREKAKKLELRRKAA